MKKIEQNFLSLLGTIMFDFYDNNSSKKYLEIIRDICEYYAEEYSTRYKGSTILQISAYHPNKLECILTSISVYNMTIAVKFTRFSADDSTIGLSAIEAVEFK